MRGTSKVIMGATLVMVVSLAIVLGLILVLLAELYCSLLLRRRRQHQLPTTSATSTRTATVATTTTNGSASPAPHPQNQSVPPPLTNLYAHGVLRAPRSFLFPTIPCKDDTVETHKRHLQLEKKIENQIQPQTQKDNLPVSPSTQPSPSTTITKQPQPIEEMPKISNADEHFVYISNPIYDNEARRSSGINTPFETPDTSPSRLEMSESSSSSDEERIKPSSLSSPPMTPPLTPMKKLPAEACSVSLRDARSLGTSGSDSNGVSSSSSGTPCTSPSW